MFARPIFRSLRGRLRSLSPVWLDVGLVVLVMAVQLWPFLSRANPAGGPWHWWGYAVVTAAALPLLWRRRGPVAALLTSLVATGLYDAFGAVPAQPIWYGGLVALYTVAACCPQWIRVAMLAVTIGGSLVIGSSETALRSSVLFVAAYAIGRASAASRAHAAALRERAERLEHERQVETERAAERERARIARDMHDILSHAVTVMVVQAEAGPVVLGSDPARAEAAFDAIASAGRDAMIQLRRILTVLRTDDGPHAPQPTLDDLTTLVGNAFDTGVTMTYAVSGEPLPVSADVEIAVYRITQEAITNIVRHADAGHADIRLVWGHGALVIDIADDGRGAPSSLPSGGNGLIGIRERAAACGGDATTGPRPDGRGFRVRARFPVTTRGARE
jgi:signal transduction histidine kinase